MLTFSLYPETPMYPRIPSAAKIRRRPRLVVPLHPPCRRRLTLLVPSNIRIHILRHNHLRHSLQASRHRARRSTTCHPCMAITSLHSSNRRLKNIRIPFNRHRTQRVRRRLSITSKGRMSSPRVQNRLKHLLVQLLCRQPISTIKGTKC